MRRLQRYMPVALHTVGGAAVETVEMRKSYVLACSLLFVGATALPAQADPLVLNLDCVISNNDCSPSALYGQIIISQVDSDTVNILVDLTPTGVSGPNKVLDLYLNYGGALPDSAFSVSGASAPTSLDFDENLTPYHSDFSIRIDPRGQSFDPYSVNLSVNTGTLSVEDFNLVEPTFDLLYAAVHIGSCGPNGSTCLPGVAGNNSIKVGSTGPAKPVSEPATLTMMGLGLFGLLGYARRRNRADSLAPTRS